MLGEAETTLTHPRSDAGDPPLIANVVQRNGPRLASTVRRDFPSAHPPDFMVRSAFVAIDALPLTSSSKVDRAALPPPGDEGLTPGTILQPRTPVERRVAEIWTDVDTMLAALKGLKARAHSRGEET